MSLLSEGTWPCTVLSASAGEEVDQAGNPTGVIRARIAVKIDDGPSKGRTCTYEDEVNAKSSIYVGRSLTAVGWKGKTNGGDLTTVAADCESWIKETGGKSTVEVRHIPIKKGKKFDKWIADGQKGAGPIWDKVNAIGGGPRALAQPSKTALADARDAMRRAFADDGGAPPPDGPQPDDDRIPFATCSAVSLGEIAKVLK